LLPDYSVYVEKGRLELAGDVAGSAAVVLSWPVLFVPRDQGNRGPSDRLCVMTWARARALPQHSVAEFCRGYGIERRTFDRRRKRALAAIAEALNRELAGKGAPVTATAVRS
jgi:hypothetical protein